MTSRSVPSENRATERSWTSRRGSTTVASVGVTRSSFSFGASGASAGMPAAIQRRRISYGFDPAANRIPPSCGSSPVGFRRSRLRSGVTGSTRRDRTSRLRMR